MRDFLGKSAECFVGHGLIINKCVVGCAKLRSSTVLFEYPLPSIKTRRAQVGFLASALLWSNQEMIENQHQYRNANNDPQIMFRISH
jgi:hypothetical protein